MMKWIGLGIALTALIIVAAAFLLARGMGVHRFDDSQVPVITVGPGLRPVIQFEPDAAYSLQVYEGPEDGDGLGVLWTARGPGGGYENTLRSPVTYGEPPEGSEVRPAPPLEPGKVYTVTVYRKDPEGQGDGFFNTRHRYDGQHTFTATDDAVGAGAVESAVATTGTPADLQGTAWQWVSFHSGKEAFDIDHPERYTIAFEEEGIVFIQADCNRGSGPVASAGPGSIDIGPIALTKMGCPPESHGDLFVQSLEHAVLYFFQDDTLYIERPIESGTLGFERVTPESTP